MDVLAAVQVQAGIVALDACRDNCLSRMCRSANIKGFAPSDGGGGLLLA
jgi:hypothetical protein